MSGVREQAKATEDEIHSTINHLISTMTEMLRNREVALIKDVAIIKLQKEKELQLQKDELEFLLTGIRHAVMFSEAMMTEGSDTEIVAGHQQVVSRMTTLTKEREKAQLEPVAEAKIEFMGLEESEELVNSVIRELGAVVATGISAGQSTIETPTGSNHQVHQLYSFKMRLVDHLGNKASSELLSKEIKNLVVEVTGPFEAKVHEIFGSCFLDSFQYVGIDTL